MNPLDLIKTARRLTEQMPGRPRQSDLKRAVSTAYYALFHALCRNSADHLIGKGPRLRGKQAWPQAYRAIEHGFAKNQCLNSRMLGEFPDEIRDFAGYFAQFQTSRHAADYDPSSRFTKSMVVSMIDLAENAIKAFDEAGDDDKRAFAAWTALKYRKPEEESRAGA